MNTHAAAIARLDGAIAAHMPATIATLIANTLRRHPTNCGLQHILGRPQCAAYDEALHALGLTLLDEGRAS